VTADHTGQKKCAGCKQWLDKGEFLSQGIRKSRCLMCAAAWRKDYLARRPDIAETVRQSNKDRRRRDWQKTLLRGSKSSARTRGLANDLTVDVIEDLWVKQEGRCYWFGVGLQLGQAPRHPLIPSLDRLDNSKGYHRGNVVLSCFAANMGRGVCSAKDFNLVVAALAAALRETHDQPGFVNGDQK
jgi:hypothetical protein